jgi:2',3'-cyclic-nucleotide 2'-phosphodiesterase (5'-nucleotidase family)
LLLDTGDALVGGAPLGDLTRGEVVVAGMNLMGYQAMALGPKELSLGLDVLQQRLDEAQFPFLSANAVLSATGELVVAPYTTLEVGPYRVGILGLTRPMKKPPAGIQVLDPQAALEQYVPQLAGQVEVIVVLTNLGYRQAISLVRAVPGVDLLVAALPDQLPEQAMHAPDTGTWAVAAEQPVARHTGRRVGHLEVTIRSDGSLADPSWVSLPLDARFADDPDMTKLLAGFPKP